MEDSLGVNFLTLSGWRSRAMPSAVNLREDYLAEELRALARRSKDVNQSRRLLSLAAVRDGKERGEAARIGGMDRQTLRDWVHRFNAAGPDGPPRQVGERSEAAAVARSADGIRPDRRDRSGSESRRRGVLAPDR